MHAHLKTYLELLTGSVTSRIYTRIISADGDEEVTRSYEGTISEHLATLEAHNIADCGVFCTVNETVGGSRMEHITALRAVYADYDHGIPTHWALQPTMIVQSSPGKGQAYWCLQPFAPLSDLQRYRGVLARVVKSTGADVHAKDASRVLRLPGFVNTKYPERPLVTLLEASGIKYTLDQIVAAYGMETLPVIDNVSHIEGEALPPVEQRVERFRRYVHASASHAPVAGTGGRNAWTYTQAARAVRDFALPNTEAVTVLVQLHEHIYGDQAYDQTEIERIVDNACRHASGSFGAAVVSQPTVATVEILPEAPAPAQRAGGSQRQEASEKIARLAREAVVALSSRYRVVSDSAGITSIVALVAGEPGLVQPVDQKVVVAELIVRYLGQLTPSACKNELLPAWMALANQQEGIKWDAIKPFVLADQTGWQWTWQKLGFRYNQNAPCPPEFSELLSRTTDDERRSLVLWLGSLLDYNFPRAQYLYLWGDGNDGKSTLLKALISVFNKQGVTQMRSEDFADIHSTTVLEGCRLLLFSDENNSGFMSSGRFKALTGDDLLTVNPKGAARRNIALHCKVMICSNNEPHVQGGRADIRRLIPVRLQSYTGGSDESYVQRFVAAGPAIMEYCYAEFRKWQEACPNKSIPTSDAAVEDISAGSTRSNVEDALDAAFAFSDDAKTPCTAVDSWLKKMFPNYRDYMTAYAVLKSKGCARTRPANGSRQRVWTGIKFVDRMEMQ